MNVYRQTDRQPLFKHDKLKSCAAYGAILAKTFKTSNSVTSEQCRVSCPQFLRSTHGTPGTMAALSARKMVAFSDSGFPTEAQVIKWQFKLSSLSVVY